MPEQKRHKNRSGLKDINLPLYCFAYPSRTMQRLPKRANKYTVDFHRLRLGNLEKPIKEPIPSGPRR